jgi:Winged helix-turn-helix DNA-binding
MAGYVEPIRKQIEDRLEELQPYLQEAAQLQTALAVLLDVRSAPLAFDPPLGHSTRAPYARGRRRASRGANREVILRLVGERPGITAREVADQTAISVPVAHTTISQLKSKGILERDGHGIKLAEQR